MIKFLRFIPVQLTICLIVGILVGSILNIQPISLLVISSCLLLLFLFVYLFSNRELKTSLIFAILTFTISFLVGLGSITYKNQLNKNLHYANNVNFLEKVPMLSVVSISKVLKPSSYYNKFEGVVTQFNKQKTIGSVLINVKKDSADLALNVDDSFVAKLSFEAIKAPLNPHTFNYKKYLKNHQIHYQTNPNYKDIFKLDTAKNSIKGFAALFRNKINESLIKNGFKDDELAVVNALLLGQRQTISKELLESYSGAGAIHILAVSGLHIGILLLLLNFLLKPLHYFKYGKTVASILVVVLMWMYAVVAGLSPSVIRAVTMFTAVAIGLYLNKPSNIYNTLVISMFFLLLFNPYYLFEVGFQLSYLAVFSIVWIQPKLSSLWVSKWWVFRKLWGLFAVSVAAQVGVLPLSLFYFHQFPGLFMLANLVIIPFIGFILIFGIFIIFLSFFEILPSFLAYSYIFVIDQMNSFVKWIASNDVFIIKNISISLVLMLSVYLFLLLSIKWIEKKQYSRLVLVFISIIMIQIVVVYEKYELESSKEFIVFNSWEKSVVGVRLGNELIINTLLDSIKNQSFINSYLVGKNISNNFSIEEQQYYYKFMNERILVVDSLGIYNYKNIKPSIVILQNSPKINLDRLLQKLQPKLIVAGPLNYKSSLIKWEETCENKKTPFYNSMQKGAFILSD